LRPLFNRALHQWLVFAEKIGKKVDSRRWASRTTSLGQPVDEQSGAIRDVQSSV